MIFPPNEQFQNDMLPPTKSVTPKGLHWSQKVVTLATFSPLAAPEVITRQYAIIVATAGTESYDNDNPRSTK